MDLTHVRLLTRDFRAAFLFYRDILGLETRFPDEAGPYAEFDLGGDRYLGLFDGALMGEALGTTTAAKHERGADSTVLVFEVEDPDAEAERLAALGVGIVAAPADRPAWGLRTVHVRDPDGNLIELFRGL